MFRSIRFTGFVCVLGLAACENRGSITQPGAVVAHRTNRTAPAPAGLVAVDAFGSSLALWPFTGTDVAGTRSDPINLVFAGQADPRDIRSALMALDGDRTAFGFPASMPFDCRWSDTPSGGMQATYTGEGGWSGSAIQLQCGDFAPLRFHVRLFRAGSASVGSAHFEVVIPGTTEHQVLSWELAEQLITVDLMRTGLLDAAAPLMPTAPINPAPSFRAIPAIIFNGLPAELQVLARGTPGSVSADVPIASDGRATAFNLAARAAIQAPGTSREFTIQYDQVIPKPFCGGPGDYLYVRGPVRLSETATLDGSRYETQFHAEGQLEVVPIDPSTGQPSGPAYRAVVRQAHRSSMDDRAERAHSDLSQILISRDAGGRLTAMISVDSRTAYAATTVRCGIGG